MTFTVLSLGAGVQSSTLLLMACNGLIEKPDVAIFADTGWERKVTYDHLKWLTLEAAKSGIPIITVQERNVRDDSLNAAELNKGYYFMPVFMDKKGVLMMSRRQCTDRYKLQPIFHKVRDLLGVSRRERIMHDAVEMWIGISLDEARRMSTTRNMWIGKRYPLIERMMTRNDCIKWLQDNYHITVPKSACIGCPFHSNTEWQKIHTEPDEWEDAVLVDETIRHGSKTVAAYTQYLHRSGRPLRDIDLRTPEEKGQLIFPFYKEEKLKLFATTNPSWAISK